MQEYTAATADGKISGLKYSVKPNFNVYVMDWFFILYKSWLYKLLLLNFILSFMC